jgi:hypothetical protein
MLPFRRDYYLRGRSYNTAFFPIALFIVALLLRKRLFAAQSRNIV